MLKARGIDCEFLCVHLAQDGEKYRLVSNPLEAAGIKVHFIETDKELSFKLLKKIQKVIESGNFSLIHSHLIHSDIWMVLVKLLFIRNLKIVSTKHGYQEIFYTKFGLDPTKRMYNAFYFASLFVEKFIARSFAVSEGVRKVYIGLNIAKSDKIDTIHLSFEPKKDLVLSPKTENFNLTTVGRLVECKGHEYLLRALPKVIEKYPETQLKIVGDGDFADTLKQLSKDLGIEKNVSFLGFRQDAMQLVQQANIAIIPSKSEGFGIVFLEAFEVKTPVIAFDVPACNEIIDNGKNGYLVSPFDTDELANKIIDLLKNPSKRTQFAEAAFKKLNTVFTPEIMLNKTIDFYKKVLD